MNPLFCVTPGSMIALRLAVSVFVPFTFPLSGFQTLTPSCHLVIAPAKLLS